MIIKHIDVISAGKMMGIIMAAVGLLAGLMFFVFGSVFSAALGQQGGGLAMLGGVMGIVVMPILYGIFGFIGGMFQAFIYNMASGFVGGIRVETE